ncbi:hypothetical protein [Nocardia sp. CA-290969]|uniref:hypothetical protein n=1 Tax=Nocardia sp. CA-290969 TaxID=3239986 RepID=UPI003D8B2877
MAIRLDYNGIDGLTQMTTAVVSHLQDLAVEIQQCKTEILSIYEGTGAGEYETVSRVFDSRIEAFQASLAGLNQKIIQVGTKGGDVDTVDQAVANWFRGIV